VTTDVIDPVVMQSSNSDKIALGVGLGIGIPALTVSCAAAYWTYKSWKEKKAQSGH
jgi:hypothetical protein